MSGNNHALMALETPTVLHFFPAAVRPDGFSTWIEPTSRQVRHVAVFVCFGVRYADDIIILTDSEEQAQKALANMADFMHHPLRLELKPAKTNWGEALYFGTVGILAYAVTVTVAAHLLVVLVEEPELRQRFGEQFDTYCRRVPRWLPAGRKLGSS